MPRIIGILETALYVSELTKSIDFYERLFGFKNLGSNKRMATLRVAENQVLLLFKKGGSVIASETSYGIIPPSDGDGNLHLAFGVTKNELDDWENLLSELEISIESKVEWPEGGKSIYFRDPDGHSLELKTSDWDNPIEF